MNVANKQIENLSHQETKTIDEDTNTIDRGSSKEYHPFHELSNPLENVSTPSVIEPKHSSEVT